MTYYKVAIRLKVHLYFSSNSNMMLIREQILTTLETQKIRQCFFQFAFNKWVVNLLLYASLNVAKRSSTSGFGEGVFLPIN